MLRQCMWGGGRLHLLLSGPWLSPQHSLRIRFPPPQLRAVFAVHSFSEGLLLMLPGYCSAVSASRSSSSSCPCCTAWLPSNHLSSPLQAAIMLGGQSGSQKLELEPCVLGQDLPGYSFSSVWLGTHPYSHYCCFPVLPTSQSYAAGAGEGRETTGCGGS